MEMAQDVPDLPIGMLTDLHLKRGWAFSCSVSPIFYQFYHEYTISQLRKCYLNGDELWSLFLSPVLLLMLSGQKRATSGSLCSLQPDHTR
jgi:hypothetical protein